MSIGSGHGWRNWVSGQLEDIPNVRPRLEGWIQNTNQYTGVGKSRFTVLCMDKYARINNKRINCVLYTHNYKPTIANLCMFDSQNGYKHAACFCLRKYGCHAFVVQISCTNYNAWTGKKLVSEQIKLLNKKRKMWLRVLIWPFIDLLTLIPSDIRGLSGKYIAILYEK